MQTASSRPSPFPPADFRAFLQSSLLGVLPLLLLLTLMLQSFNLAVQVIVLSTICTLGLGGMFWIAMAFVLGITLQQLIPELRDRRLRSPRSDTTAGLSPYIAARLATGVDAAAVRQQLIRAGWRLAEIDAAITEVHRQSQARSSEEPGGTDDAR